MKAWQDTHKTGKNNHPAHKHNKGSLPLREALSLTSAFLSLPCIMMLTPISVVIVAHDAAKTIESCLVLLNGFDEGQLIDDLTSDNTAEICSRFSNTQIAYTSLEGFGKIKKSGYSRQNEWVLSVDADEVLSPVFWLNFENVSCIPNVYMPFNGTTIIRADTSMPVRVGTTIFPSGFQQETKLQRCQWSMKPLSSTILWLKNKPSHPFHYPLRKWSPTQSQSRAPCPTLRQQNHRKKNISLDPCH